jgi:hypothetical protein
MMRDQDTGDLNDWLPKQPVNPRRRRRWLHSLCRINRMHRRCGMPASAPSGSADGRPVEHY